MKGNKNMNMTAITVSNVRKFSETVYFDVEVYGVKIYGMRVITKSDGEKFISFPSSKGKDGKYYNHAWFKMSADEQKALINTVLNTAG